MSNKMPDFSMWWDIESTAVMLMGIVVPWFVLYVFWTILKSGPRSSIISRPEKNVRTAPYRSQDTSIDALHGFDWQKTEPLAIRPFKQKYHLTMGELGILA